jgi:hypothetical protein
VLRCDRAVRGVCVGLTITLVIDYHRLISSEATQYLCVKAYQTYKVAPSKVAEALWGTEHRCRWDPLFR